MLKDLWNKTKNSAKELKDSTISTVVQKTCNYYIKEFGEMLNFQLNSQDKSVTLEVMLKGEKEPLKATIKEYEIIEENDKAYLRFEDIQTSREWINTVLETFVDKDDKKIEIPRQYVKLLGVVI
jgi:hypothetical protein